MKSTTTIILCSLIASTYGRVIEKDSFINSRVINGENATVGERPFQVSLQDQNHHFCGGSIINEFWVVTAAHCVTGLFDSPVTIVSGTVSLKKPYRLQKSEKVIVHKNFNFDGNDDIALIKVATPFKFSFRVQPVNLPKPHLNVKTNSSAVLSGWGRMHDSSIPDRLQKATIYIADQEYCRAVMEEQNMKIFPTNICANDPNIRRGQCNGDSGGPLTVDGKLTGIVSWSIKDPTCASTKYPGVYSRVSEYIDWIEENIKS